MCTSQNLKTQQSYPLNKLSTGCFSKYGIQPSKFFVKQPIKHTLVSFEALKPKKLPVIKLSLLPVSGRVAKWLTCLLSNPATVSLKLATGKYFFPYGVFSSAFKSCFREFETRCRQILFPLWSVFYTFMRQISIQSFLKIPICILILMLKLKHFQLKSQFFT